MAINIQFRRGTASEWTAANPTLAVAEFGVETDTDKFKLGDGATAWTSLAYGGIQGPAGADGTSGVAAATAPLAYNSGTSTVSIDLSAYDTSSEVDTKLADYDTSAEVDTKLTDYDTSAEVDTKVADSKLASFVTDSTTSRTLLSTDAGKTIKFTSSSATALTVDATAGFSFGDRAEIIAYGTGELTVTASNGGLVKGAEVSTGSGSFTIGAQYSAATLLCVGNDDYILIGNIAAV